MYVNQRAQRTRGRGKGRRNERSVPPLHREPKLNSHSTSSVASNRSSLCKWRIIVHVLAAYGIRNEKVYGLNPGLLLPAITKSEPSVINDVDVSSDSDDKFDPLLTETVFYQNPVPPPPSSPVSTNEPDAIPKQDIYSTPSTRGGRRGRRGGKRTSSIQSRGIMNHPPEPKRSALQSQAPPVEQQPTPTPIPEKKVQENAASTPSNPNPSEYPPKKTGRQRRSTPYQTRYHTAHKQPQAAQPQPSQQHPQETAAERQHKGKKAVQPQGQQEEQPQENAVLNRCIAITSEPLPVAIGNDYKEFLNCCRFVKFISSSTQQKDLFDLWKDFRASDSYLATKKTPLVVNPKTASVKVPEKPKDESVIESSESSQIEEEKTEQGTTAESKSNEETHTDLIPRSIEPSIFISSHAVEELSDPIQATVIGSICSCIRTEMDFLSLSRYTLLNHAVLKYHLSPSITPSSWIPVMFTTGTLAQPFLANHIHHFLNWTTCRLTLSLDTVTVLPFLFLHV